MPLSKTLHNRDVMANLMARMKLPMGAPIDRSLVWIFFFAWRFAIDLVYLGEAVRPEQAPG